MRYNGDIDSRELNRKQEEALMSLSDISKKVNKSILDMELYKKVSEVELVATNSFVERVLERTNKEIIPTSAMKIVNAVFNSKDNCITKTPLDIRDRLKQGDYMVEDLYVELFDENEYKEVTDYGIENMLIKKGTWCREITTEKPYAITTLVVSIPSSINANTIVNHIEFSTFPYYTCSIENVEFSPYYDNKYLTPLDTLVNHKGHVFNPYEIEGSPISGSATLCFKDVDMKKIAITLKQEIKSDDNKYFVGIKDLRVEYRIYNNEKAIIDIPFKGNTGDRINALVLEGNNNGYNVDVYNIIAGEEVFIQTGIYNLVMPSDNIIFRVTMDDNYFFIRSARVVISDI